MQFARFVDRSIVPRIKKMKINPKIPALLFITATLFCAKTEIPIPFNENKAAPGGHFVYQGNVSADIINGGSRDYSFEIQTKGKYILHVMLNYSENSPNMTLYKQNFFGISSPLQQCRQEMVNQCYAKIQGEGNDKYIISVKYNNGAKEKILFNLFTGVNSDNPVQFQ